MSISDKIREAREWSHCIDTLKASVDSMYEICRIQQNILGCEEAIMFLKNGIRDFFSLIDTIKIEQNWENSEKRPTAPIAWEIRGTNAKNNLAPPAKNVKEVECQTTEVGENVGDTRRTNENEKREENEWQLVERKRCSARHEQTARSGEVNVCPFIPIGKARKAPKSAMDLPQTKASMAKMAYSRQLLFEKHKKTLLEKFNAKRRIEKALSDREGQMKSKGTAETKAKAPAELSQMDVGTEEGKERRIAGCLKTLIDQLSDDCEWKAMTEEEESLAQEEESLKKEIEEEEEENLPDFVDDFVDNGNLEELPEKSGDGTIAKEGQSECEAKEGTVQANGAEPSHYRNPGELAQLRAKLLSPTKRRRAEDIDYSSENKLRRAEELRTLLKQEKTQRLHLLHRRVGEVRAKREEIQQKKMAHLDMVKERIQKAEENRQKSLEEIVQKAQEDEMKIIEINLLNSFEAANQRLGKRFTQFRERNRHAKMVRKAEEERQKRIEENRQQREEAEKRRRDAEEQRTKRLKDQASQRLERQCNALKHRTKAMEKYRAKVAQHSQKISQRKESELADKQKLLDKIQKKQEKRTENYEQCKEQVRRRAMELSSPRPAHLWAQTLADFSQMPSDLALQQKPTNSDRTDEGEVEEAGESKGGCFRCGTKEIFRNDLHLLSHIMSEEHLAKAERMSQSLLQSAVISYDFMKSELERMTSSVTAQNSEDFAEVMCKSTDESCSLGSVPMDKIIAKNAEMSISDQHLMKLLMFDEINEKNNGNGTKKKRTKIRHKIIRELEMTAQKENDDDWSGEIGQKTAAQQKSAKMLNTLQTKVEKLGNSAEEGQLEEDALKGVQRKVTELISALRNEHNAKERATLRKMILQTKVLDKLLPLINLIGQRKSKVISSNELGMRILTKSLALFGILVDSEDTPTNIHSFGPNTLRLLCDLFQQNATKPFVTANAPPFPAVAFLSPSLSVALFIVHQLGRLITRHKNPDSTLSVFSFLCSYSLLEFVSLCAKQLEPNELLQGTSWPDDLELCQGEKKLSVCEVITSFVASLLENNYEEKEETDQRGQKEEGPKQPALARHNSAESQGTTGGRSCSSSGGGGATPRPQQNPNHKLRLCAVLWMYCLSVIAFHHFRQQSAAGGGNLLSDGCPLLSNSANSSASNPPSPSKSDRILSTEMTATLSMCLLRQFNAIAEFSSRQQIAKGQQQTHNPPTMFQSFLSVETGQAMALRMTCIFRSILQFVHKSTNAPQTDALTAQCIRAIGHFAVGDIQNQLFCVFGWRRSVLSMLCTSLPLNFVHSEPQKHFLLPSLIAVLRNSPIGVDQIRTEFCLQYLVGYLKAAIEAKTSKRKSDSSKFDFLSLLEPSVGKWVAAKEFFESISRTNDLAV